ncbi:hypothetical protein [Intestinibacter bartlettii]|uniref:hypothetical protein n=1 Tax=Intestinibacter bartlettii TaxID=261299 RepID=UPI0034A28814
MKKLSAILLMIIFTMTTVACSNKEKETNQQYEQAMADGKSNVIEEEYDKAISYFELALESKENDTEATNLIKQLKLLTDAMEKDGENDINICFNQLKIINEINSITTKTNVVKEKSNNYKKVVLNNIDKKIDSLETEAKKGNSEKKIKNMIKKCEEYQLEDEVDRCNEILSVCRDKKEEIKAQKEAEQIAQKNAENSSKNKKSKSFSSKQAWCIRGGHYTDAKNILKEFNSCKGCQIKRDIHSGSTYTGCMYCGSESRVPQDTGICLDCGAENHPPIVDVTEDGIVVYADGTTMEWNFANM